MGARPPRRAMRRRRRASVIGRDPRRPGVLYAATRAPSDDLPVAARVGDGVFGSVDGDATWTPLSAGLGDTHIGALALDPATRPRSTPPSRVTPLPQHGCRRSWRRVGVGAIRGSDG